MKIVFLISFLIAVLMVSVGILHNPQYEFINENGEIDYLYTVFLFLSWFFLFFFIGIIIKFIINKYYK